MLRQDRGEPPFDSFWGLIVKMRPVELLKSCSSDFPRPAKVLLPEFGDFLRSEGSLTLRSIGASRSILATLARLVSNCSCSTALNLVCTVGDLALVWLFTT